LYFTNSIPILPSLVGRTILQAETSECIRFNRKRGKQMSLFFYITLYILQILAITTGVTIALALGLGLLLIRELNLILSVTEEQEIPAPIDTDSFEDFPILSIACAESTAETVSSLPSN
jgi:hypothetical protein